MKRLRLWLRLWLARKLLGKDYAITRVVKGWTSTTGATQSVVWGSAAKYWDENDRVWDAGN